MTERRTGRLPQTFARRAAAEINTLIDGRVTGQRLAEILDRGVGYVSERRTGKASWTLDDIDVIAGELGIDAMGLLMRVGSEMRREDSKGE